MTISDIQRVGTGNALRSRDDVGIDSASNKEGIGMHITGKTLDLSPVARQGMHLINLGSKALRPACRTYCVLGLSTASARRPGLSAFKAFSLTPITTEGEREKIELTSPPPPRGGKDNQ